MTAIPRVFGSNTTYADLVQIMLDSAVEKALRDWRPPVICGYCGRDYTTYLQVPMKCQGCGAPMLNGCEVHG